MYLQIKNFFTKKALFLLLILVVTACSSSNSDGDSEKNNKKPSNNTKPIIDTSPKFQLFNASATGVDVTKSGVHNNMLNGMLWISDGTSNGSKRLNANVRVKLKSKVFFANGNKVVFAGQSISHGIEPWVSDGTQSGTFMLKDISANGINGIRSNNEKPFTRLGNKLYFTAYETTNTGLNPPLNDGHLYETDGTSAGTKKILSYNDSMNIAGKTYTVKSLDVFADKKRLYMSLREQASNNNSIFIFSPEKTGAARFTLLKKDYEILHLYYTKNKSIAIAITSGSGAHIVLDMQSSNAVRLGNSSLHDGDLYRVPSSDGYMGETFAFLLKKLTVWKIIYIDAAGNITTSTVTSPVSGINNIGNILDNSRTPYWVNNQFYIYSRSSFNKPLRIDKNGQSTWQTIGAKASTLYGGMGRYHNAIFAGKLVFAASNEDTHAATSNCKGQELWVLSHHVLDMLKDINQKPCSAPSSSASIKSFIGQVGGNKMLFSADDDDSYGLELWITDGTENGTKLLKDITSDAQDGVHYD